jgi:WD40 repeat protein
MQHDMAGLKPEFNARSNLMYVPSTYIVAASFSPDGKNLATAGFDKAARLWNLDGTPRSLIRHPLLVFAAAFTPDSQRLLTFGVFDMTVRSFDARTGKRGGAERELKEYLEVDTTSEQGCPVQFSQDARKLVVACRDNAVRVFDVASGARTGEPMQHPELVRTLAFSPDGNRVITGCKDGKARHWDATTGTLGKQLAFPAEVTAVAFAPDGQMALVFSDNGKARIWRPNTGESGAAFEHPGGTTVALFSKSGRTFLSGSRRGIAYWWELPNLP